MKTGCAFPWFHFPQTTIEWRITRLPVKLRKAGHPPGLAFPTPAKRLLGRQWILLVTARFGYIAHHDSLRNLRTVRHEILTETTLATAILKRDLVELTIPLRGLTIVIYDSFRRLWWLHWLPRKHIYRMIWLHPETLHMTKWLLLEKSLRFHSSLMHRIFGNILEFDCYIIRLGQIEDSSETVSRNKNSRWRHFTQVADALWGKSVMALDYATTWLFVESIQPGAPQG